MRIAVLYRSKSGYTERYARWISERLAADLLRVGDIRREDLAPYGLVIYGAGLYAAGINGLKTLLRQLEAYPEKQLVVFAVGVTPARPEVVPEVIAKNLPKPLQDKVPLFYLRGGFNAGRLTAVDRLLMAVLKLKLRLKPRLGPDERGMLAACERPVDFTGAGQLTEIIACVETLTGAGGQAPDRA